MDGSSLNPLWIYNINYFTVCSKDLEQIVSLDSEFLEEVKNYGDISRKIKFFVWPKEDYIFYLTRRNYLYTVAKDKNKIIGFCLSFISRTESELYKIIISKNYRGKKVGKTLLSYHLSYLKFKGIKVSFLEVSLSNTVAMNLYKKVGYTQVYLRRNYYITADALVMQKFL